MSRLGVALSRSDTAMQLLPLQALASVSHQNAAARVRSVFDTIFGASDDAMTARNVVSVTVVTAVTAVTDGRIEGAADES